MVFGVCVAAINVSCRMFLVTGENLIKLRFYCFSVFPFASFSQARPMSSCGVCLSVCVSVMFVSSVKANKHIIKFFFTIA